MYKAIGFDMGGVLIYYSIPDSIKEIARYFGVEERLVKEAMGELRPLVDVGRINNIQFWTQLLQKIGSDKDPEETEHIWSDSYIKKNPFVPGSMELVERLKSAGYKVGMLSNIDPEHGRLNYGRHIFEHFDVALLSYEEGVRKPEPEAFQLLCDRLGIQPKELIFIDDLLDNVAGADKFGATGILFEGHEKLVQRLTELGIEV
ncbi:MAG TPA: HAD family phosphatase [Candidatus Nanoarchaeia archaeon]|nr:HAD family phosphatase [Candidatus Nanoarchaeia archaeon]